LVTLSYILKDLSRRRFQTLSAIGTLALSMGGLTFLVLYGLALGFNYSKLPWRASVGLNYIFAAFILIASILVFLIGLVALSSFSSMLTGLRVRDIGIMKAIGLAEEVNSFFLFESLVITFLGCITGIVGGLLSFFLTTVFLRISGFSVVLVQPFLIASILFILGMVITFISIYLPLHRSIMKLQTSSALSPQTTKLSLGNLSRRSIFRVSSAFKIASRSALGDKESSRTLIALFLISCLLSIIIFGGQIISGTAQNYVDKGIGEGVFLIAHKDIVTYYVNRLSFNPIEYVDAPNFSNPEYSIPVGFVDWLRSQPYVKGFDPRFITELTAYEVKFVTPIPDGYKIVGDDRKALVLALGVNPGDVLNDWVLSGRFINESDNSTLAVGDSLLDVVYDINQEHLKILGRDFSIAGACVDPLNGGYTVYLKYEALQAMTGFKDPNVILVKLDLEKTSVSDFEVSVQHNNLELYDLNGVLGNDLKFLQDVWLSLSTLPSLTIFIGGLILANFTALSVSARSNDFRVMKAVGAKRKDLRGIIVTQTFLLVILGAVPGVIVGWIFCSYFLILSPSLPSVLTMAIDIGVLAAMFATLSLISAYYVGRMIPRAVI
jgi:ABC-type antimicrobial peptide transport system permease subunit